MDKAVLLVGEPMGLFIAQNTGEFEDVNGYDVSVAGAEFNVAVGLKRLGHSVSYVTKLGDDPFGKRIVKVMNENSIATDNITYSDIKTTGFMLKAMTEHGDPKIFYFRKGSAASTLSEKDIENIDFSRYDYVHMTGILPALSDSTRKATEMLFKKAKENGIKISFDPNLRPQLWGDKELMRSFINNLASKSDIFLPGINEAEILIGEKDPEKIAEKYLKSGCKAVVVKLGEEGAYYNDGYKSERVGGYKVEKIVDTVGAGDGFAVGVLSALREGLSYTEALKRGNAVGAIQVMSRGDNDGLPTKTELKAFMNYEKDWRKV